MTDDEKIEVVTAKLTGVKLEINRELVISTAHMPKMFADHMHAGHDLGFAYEGLEHGWLVYTGWPHINTSDFGEIQLAIELARANNCKWLHLDSDGLIVPGLPKWEW